MRSSCSGDLVNWLTGQSGNRVSAVLGTRMPRVLAAVLAGAALALAGALIQAVSRNSLAEPGILGVSGGGGLAAIIVITTVPTAGSWVVTGSALGGGAALSALLVFGLAFRGGLQQNKLVLIGIGISAGLAAAITVLLVTTDPFNQTKALTWLSGSTYGRNFASVLPPLLALVLALPVLAGMRRDLDLIAVDDDSPRVLGVGLSGSRVLLLTVAVLLTAGAVSSVGVIAFVGLVAPPHAARTLVGARHSRVLPVAALIGACTVVLADVIGRTVIAPPAQIPAGIMTALVGAPPTLCICSGVHGWTARSNLRGGSPLELGGQRTRRRVCRGQSHRRLIPPCGAGTVILIVGGTGRLGVRVVSDLAGAGQTLRIMARGNSQPLPDTKPSGVEVVRGDLSSRSDCMLAVEGCRQVVFAASGFGLRRGGGTPPRSVDRDGALRILEAAKRDGVEHLVMMSMHGAATDAPLEFLRMKFAAEEALRSSGMAWTIIRMGANLEQFVASMSQPLKEKGKVLVFGSGRAPVTFTSTADAAALVVRAVADPALRGANHRVGIRYPFLQCTCRCNPGQRRRRLNQANTSARLAHDVRCCTAVLALHGQDGSGGPLDGVGPSGF